MDPFEDLPLAAWVAAAGVALVALVVFLRCASVRIRRRWQLISVRGRLVAKRAATYGRVSSTSPGRVYTLYFATFETNAGERVEFQIPDAAYGLMVEGDEGTLTYRGGRWFGFERKTPSRGTGRRKAIRSR